MSKRGKKGQVTLFIIIAIVVVAAAALTIFFWPRISSLFMSQQQAQTMLASEAEPLRENIYECIKINSEDIFEVMGLQAGYYDASNLFAIDFAGPKYIVMYKDDNKVRVNKLPSLERMKQEYLDALDSGGYEKIDSCLSDFASFKRKMDVEPGERKIDVEINPENVIINVDWPITISKSTISGEASQTINQKQVDLLIPLGNAWVFANDIVNYETQQIDFEDVEEEYNYNHPQLREYLSLDTAHEPTSEHVIYMIKTVPHRIEEQEYKFYFAVSRI